MPEEGGCNPQKLTLKREPVQMGKICLVVLVFSALYFIYYLSDLSIHIGDVCFPMRRAQVGLWFASLFTVAA